MSGHTPGPWTKTVPMAVNVKPHAHHIMISGPDGENVALSSSWRNNVDDAMEAEANACLIAAAPDLLEGLEECVSELEKYQNTPHPEECDGARDYLVKLMNFRAIILKAKGQSK